MSDQDPSVVFAAMMTKLKEECEAQHARAERAEAEVERLREEQAAMQRALTQTAREIRSLEKRIVERDAKVAMASMREFGG